MYDLREQSHNRSLITKTQLLIINEYDFLSSYTDFIQKLLLLDRLMCVAVVALSYFTFMFYYFFSLFIVKLHLSTLNKIYDDDDEGPGSQAWKFHS